MFLRARPASLLLAGLLGSGLAALADPLTKELELDFGRDVASRHLKGLATRSDGRILPGPVFTDLAGPKIGDILWTLQPLGAERIMLKTDKGVTDRVGAYRFLVGTGPDGKVDEVAFNPADNTYTVKEVVDLAETHAMALAPLPNGEFLVGTSPTAAVYLVRQGKVAARVPLPADSVFDFLPLPDGTILAATGNPGKIYRIDVAKLARAGIIEGKVDSDSLLADRGVTVFGEIRDRNVRRLARLPDGRIIAGSSPKGNVYSFPAAGGAPLFLQENRDAEVVDLLPQPDGSFYAALVFSGGDSLRLAKPEPKEDAAARERDLPKPGFGGRSSVVRFPANGFPETLFSRAGIALYRVVRQADWLLLTAGEQGDAFGYDPAARRSLTFAGSASAQLSDLAPIGPGRYLLLRNNAPGLATLAFDGAAARELETKRLDLGQPSTLGALRFPRLRGIGPDGLQVQASTNNGADELEGWSAWTDLKPQDDSFRADGLRGRYVRYRVKVTGAATDFQIDKAQQYHLPQNRRPSLVDFRIFPPNQGIIPAPEPAPNAVGNLGQLLFPPSRDAKDDSPDRRKGAFLNSQVVPAPGTQLVYWSVSDADGDSLAFTFSIKPDGGDTWTDVAVRTTEPFSQFETSALPEGLYLTRLTVAEQAPRPEAQRLTYTFETDHLLVDHTPPVITATEVQRTNGHLVVSVTGRDALSLLDGAEFNLNNGLHDSVSHPRDGVLDGHEETFVLEVPEARAAGATSVEVILYDQSGNALTTRVPLK